MCNIIIHDTFYHCVCIHATLISCSEVADEFILPKYKPQHTPVLHFNSHFFSAPSEDAIPLWCWCFSLFTDMVHDRLLMQIRFVLPFLWNLVCFVMFFHPT